MVYKTKGTCSQAINVELDGDVIKHVEFVGGCSGNTQGGEYEGIDAYMPRSGYPKDEVFEYNEDTRKTIANLWSKVKIAASNAE